MADDFSIKVINVNKKFKNFVAVDNISFEVKKGEIFAFLGPNGAGKSTTIKMLTTLLSPTSGTIFVNGFNAQIQKNEVRKSFGIVFQDPSLDDQLTAYENMMIHAALYKVPKKMIKPRIDELLKFVDLHNKKNDLIKTFSGGMRRRLEIARGLLHTPSVLFLDEPTTGLDPQTRNSMWEYIKAINKENNMTIFFTTHYLEEAEKNAKRIAIMDFGKIIASGTTETLKKQTSTKTLEEAFLKLTGKNIRDEEGGSLAKLRMVMRSKGR